MSARIVRPDADDDLAEPLDEVVDHVRGEAGAPVILEYGDYECPYSRQAFWSIERVERELSGHVRFAFRHFPLTEIQTLFVNGRLHADGYDPATLIAALAG